MFNPSNSYPNSSSYDDLLKRMTQGAQRTQVDSQLLSILQQSFESELGKAHIVLSRPERTRLFQDLAKAILTDVLRKIDGTK